MVYQNQRAVNAQNLHTQKYYAVPGIPKHERQRVAGVGFFDTGAFRSIRSSDGRHYVNDTINIDEAVLAQIEGDGLHTLEVVIKYKTHDVTYSTEIDTLRTYGERVLADGWQIALARRFWLVDGQAQSQAARQAESEVAQLGLFGGVD